ncbi:hypothetical protein BHM03_00026023 [Ensete ventricosum]|nr:hypothetical protein BHM03_00026023 [Ensete ventricosum]
MSSSSSPLYKRRLPLPASSHSCSQRHCPCWRQPWPLGLPLAGALQPAALAGVALQVIVPMGGCCPCVLALAASSRPLAQGLSCNRTPLCKGPWPQSADPLQVARSWLAAPVGGLAVASHPCKWLSHGRLPLVRITFATKTQQEDLRGNLSSLTVIKSKTEAWLEATGLSPVTEGMNLLGVKKVVAAKAPRLETPCPATKLATEKPVRSPLRARGVPERERGHLPRSIRDLYQVKAQAPNEPYMAQEIVRLPEMPRDSLLKARWASLTPRHKVWIKGADA